MIFLFADIYMKTIIMVTVDPTLLRIRELNKYRAWVLSEANQAGFQDMEDFYKEVKQHYADEGVTVSDKVIKFIVDVYGAEAAENPALAQSTKNIFKNPDRFVMKVLKALNVSPEKLSSMIGQVGNQAGNPQVQAQLTQEIKKLANIDQNVGDIATHVSGMHSMQENQANDTYAILKVIRKMHKQLKKMNKLSQQQEEAVDQVEQDVENQGAAKEGNCKPSKFDDLVLTNREINFSWSGLNYTGTVLLDSTDGALSQEYLDGLIKNGKSVPATVAEVQDPKKCKRVWVQSQNTIYEVPKILVKSVDEANRLAAFIPDLPVEIKSIFDKADIFFRNIYAADTKDKKTGVPYSGKDQELRRGFAKGSAGNEYERGKNLDIQQKWGMRNPVDIEGSEKGEWYSPITTTTTNVAATIVLRWLAENGLGASMEVDANSVRVFDGKMTEGVFSNQDLTIRFRPQTRGNDVGNIHNIIVKGTRVNHEQLRTFCKQHNIEAAESTERQTTIYNRFTNAK